MSAPLRDLSRGRLKGWPGGGIYRSFNGFDPTFHRAQANERARAEVVPGRQRWAYCKDCKKHVLPLILRERFEKTTEMQICSECGYGLTPPRVVTGS
jgi:hypothetical protein